MNKTIDAAVRQKNNIELIKKHYGLEQLNEGLRAVAEARLNYPEISLKELGSVMDPPLGKSGINHRMRKLEELADELRAKGYTDEE
jgi:DNA-binding protein WhiA